MSAASTTPTWYRVARVRAGGAGPSLGGEGRLFAPELVPHVTHPRVAALGADATDELLRRALVRYLHATTVLEVQVVNEVAARLSRAQATWPTPPGTRLRALQLYCDEGYHAVLSSDLMSQLGADDTQEPAPAVLTRLERQVRERARDDADAERLRFLYSVVSETAISRSLANLARNPDIVSGLREFVADHARDEARHHAFFAELFDAFWSTLTPSEARRLGAWLPDLVHAFLAPDTVGAKRDLEAVGLAGDAADAVLGEVHSPSRVQARVLDGARPVLNCFDRAGALDASTRGAFAAAGLVIGGA